MYAVPGSLFALAAELRSGHRGLLDYMRETCDRIEQVEPHVQALLPEPGRRERLLVEVQRLQARYPMPDDREQIWADSGLRRHRRKAKKRPPLYGVLLGVKDIYRVDGFETHCGSALPAELFAGPEASVVTRLKNAGALILGKTVTTEFAYFEPGPTRNPHNLEHTPGGSSSGSAAAVAAGYCPLALGSQTVGSVIRPAAFCGIPGFKTSYGRVPLDGVIPYSPSLDHFGFFVPRADDFAPVLSVILDEEEEMAPGWGALGVPDGPYLEQAPPEALAAFEQQVRAIEAQGRTVHRIPMFEADPVDPIEEINQRHQRLAAVEMSQIHQEWFEQYAELYRPRTAAWIREGQTIDDLEEGMATLGRSDLRRSLHAMMDAYQIDAWICPAATGPAPVGIASTGNPLMNLPWTYAGLPVATVPAGFVANGLPLGLQVVGRFGEDSHLAAVANQLWQIVEPVLGKPPFG